VFSTDELGRQLRGVVAGADVEVVKYPDRYVDEAGEDFWNTVTRLAGPLEGQQER
jgi:hypothetical protein